MEKFKIGIYPDMPDEEYFSIEAASKSALKDFEQSPMHYRWNRDHQGANTAAMQFGTAFHTMVLEPHLFSSTVAIVESVPRKNSKARAEFDEEHGDKIILNEKDGERLSAMHANLMSTKTGVELFDGDGMNEVAILFCDPYTGLRCKAKLDRITWYKGQPVIIDLKSARAAGVADFQRADSNLFYHAQAAFYQHALQCASPIDEVRHFIFAAVESEAPHGVAFYQPDIVAIDEGRCLYEKWLALFEYHKRLDLWPGYPDEIQPLELAPWVLARRKREESE